MDSFPIPAANGAVRAIGAKSPQGDSASDAATLFADGLDSDLTGGVAIPLGSVAGAPEPIIWFTHLAPKSEIAPELPVQNGGANSAHPLGSGQAIGSVNVGNIILPTQVGNIPFGPANDVVQVLQGKTPIPTPVVTGEAVAVGKTGDAGGSTASPALPTGNGNSSIIMTPAPSNGTIIPDSGQALQNGQAPHDGQASQHVQTPQIATAINAEIIQEAPQLTEVAAPVHISAKAAGQAAQAAAQGAAQAAGAQPALIPADQAGSRAAAQPKSSAAQNSSAKSNAGNNSSTNANSNANGGNGVNPAQNGIPSANQAQSAPGQAVARQTPPTQSALQSIAPAPLFESLLPSIGASVELAPSTGLDGSNISSITAVTRPTAQAAINQGARAMTPQQPVEQVAVQITLAVQSGADKITVQLRPENLGRVSIELELGKDNKITAVIAAERQDTLDLLQRDSRALERALNEAGLKTDSGSLSFNLRGEGDHPDTGEAGERTTHATLDLPAEDDLIAQNSFYDQSRSIGLDGAVNIRV